MPSTHQSTPQVGVRAKKRHPTRSRQDPGRQRNDDDDDDGRINVQDWMQTVSEVPEKVVQTSEAEKPNARQAKGSEALKFEELVSRMDQMEQNIGNRLTMIEQRMEKDGVVVSAQKGVIDRWKQEAGALVTTLRQVVVESRTMAMTRSCEVQSPCVPSATVGAVEKDTGNWASVLAASSVERWKPEPEEKAEEVEAPKPKPKPRRKENVEKVVQAAERTEPEEKAEEVEAPKPKPKPRRKENVEKVVQAAERTEPEEKAEEVEAPKLKPLSFLLSK